MIFAALCWLSVNSRTNVAHPGTRDARRQFRDCPGHSGTVPAIPGRLVTLISDDDMTAKIEFLGLGEDSNLKIDFAREDIGNFLVGLQNEYPILSRRALNFRVGLQNEYPILFRSALNLLI